MILIAFPSPLRAQTIQVTSATPPAAPQGTINLNVAIGGKGFAKGARAIFYLSGTTDTDGVIVNSTAYNSTTQVTANINIADTTSIAGFDIVVQNTPGRSGKGTKLFAVTAKGTPVGCTTLGTPSGFSLVTELNYVNSSGAPQYIGALGLAISVRPVVLTAGSQSKTVLVAAVSSTSASSKKEVFFLDPATGNVLDGTVIIGTQVQPHITVVTTGGGGIAAAGDVDGNGIPDFVIGDHNGPQAFVLMGYEDPTAGILSYRLVTIPAPANAPAGFGGGVAIGNFSGNVSEQNVVVGAPGGGSGKGTAGAVYIYQFNGSAANPGFNLFGSINDPLPNSKNDDAFGGSVAVGEVTGSGAANLIVGAPGANVNGVAGAGRVYVFPGPLSSTSYYALTAPQGSPGGLGGKVGAGTMTNSTATDVIASNSRGLSIFGGPITANRTAPNSTFSFYPGLTTGLVNNVDLNDMNGDTWADILVGAPNANASSSCNDSPGAAELYLSSVSSSGPKWTLIPFQAPTMQSDFMGFGWGVAVLPAVAGVSGFTPLLLVGENGADVGGVVSAGQVYVYKQQ